jgi:hypothetical protein
LHRQVQWTRETRQCRIDTIKLIVGAAAGWRAHNPSSEADRVYAPFELSEPLAGAAAAMAEMWVGDFFGRWISVIGRRLSRWRALARLLLALQSLKTALEMAQLRWRICLRQAVLVCA